GRDRRDDGVRHGCRGARAVGLGRGRARRGVHHAVALDALRGGDQPDPQGVGHDPRLADRGAAPRGDRGADDRRRGARVRRLGRLRSRPRRPRDRLLGGRGRTARGRAARATTAPTTARRGALALRCRAGALALVRVLTGLPGPARRSALGRTALPAAAPTVAGTPATLATALAAALAAVAPAGPVATCLTPAVPAPATTGRGALAGLAEVLEHLGVEARAGARAARQAALRALGDAEVGEQVRGGGVGLDGLGDAEVERLVDERPARHVVPVDERHRGALVARATRATRAVQVDLLVLGALVVDDVGDVVDVDPARG